MGAAFVAFCVIVGGGLVAASVVRRAEWGLVPLLPLGSSLVTFGFAAVFAEVFLGVGLGVALVAGFGFAVVEFAVLVAVLRNVGGAGQRRG